MASQDPVMITPNSFHLRGYDLDVTFDTISATGEARLTYLRRGETAQFRGEQIRMDRAPFGLMMVTVDLAVEMFTMIIPTVKLSPATKKVEMETIAMLSSHPAHKTEGQLQTYMPLCLTGTAENLSF